MTGFYRDGCCSSGPEDRGLHTICVVVTSEFLGHQQSIGNDLSTPMPEHSFPGLIPGDRWCVTAHNWLRAFDDGCAAPVVLAATHERTLEVVDLDALYQCAIDVPDDPLGLAAWKIRPTTDISKGRDIVYTPDCYFGVLFSERDVARRAAQVWRAVGESTTWGEFRKQLPPEDWAQVIDLFADREKEVPADETIFSSDDLPMWGDDGLYIGLWPPEEAVSWFPEDLLEKYGGHDDSANPNRDQLFLPSDAAEEIADDLRARGHRVERTLTGDLPYWLTHIGYRDPK